MSLKSQENTPSFELPSSPGQGDKNPLNEQEQFQAPVGETQHAVALEQGVSVGQPAPQIASAPTQNNVPVEPPPAVPVSQSQTHMPGISGILPQLADDTDLIEKEWVDKAKEIVAQTSHDPYLQNKEMNKVRADYMKKRYNKDIKLIED